MTFEIRMAWREIRSAYKRFLFLVVAIALGVGALTGLKGFSKALNRSISKSARDLVAADLAVRFSTPATRKEIDTLESLTARGAEISRTTETLSMVSSAKVIYPDSFRDPGRRSANVSFLRHGGTGTFCSSAQYADTTMLPS